MKDINVKIVSEYYPVVAQITKDEYLEAYPEAMVGRRMSFVMRGGSASVPEALSRILLRKYKHLKVDNPEPQVVRKAEKAERETPAEETAPETQLYVPEPYPMNYQKMPKIERQKLFLDRYEELKALDPEVYTQVKIGFKCISLAQAIEMMKNMVGANAED